MSSILGFPASQGAGSGKKFQYHMQALSSFDRVVGINYLDFGTRNQVITSIEYSSVMYPEANVEAFIFYSDIGKINQRITKIEIEGSVFLPNKLRKNFNYTLINNKYRLNSTTFELV